MTLNFFNRIPARPVAVAIALLLSVPLVRGGQKPVWPQDASDIPADPTVHFGELPNGLTYAIMPNIEPEKRVSVRLLVKAGSLEETENQRGLAHYLEHMAFNGTRDFPSDSMVEYFQRIGMGFGADTNAFTSFNQTVYMLEVPSGKPKTLTDGLRLLRNFADRMLLSPKEIDKERGVILSEMRARDSVEFRTSKAEYKFLLPDSIIPDRFPIGVKKTVDAANRKRLENFYKTWYRPGDLSVVVVGDVDPDLAEKLIKQEFSSDKPVPDPKPKPDLGKVTIWQKPVAELHSEPEASTVRVAIETMKPFHRLPDTAANHFRFLARDLADAMVQRRLDILAKKPGAPFTSGYIGAGDQFDFFINASIELTGKPADWKKSLAVADQELRRALKYGFQKPELDAVVADMVNQYENAVKATSTRQSPDLANKLVSDILHRKVFTTPQTELRLLKAALAKITPEDCAEALRKTWDEPAPAIFVTGKLTLKNPEKTILAVYNQSRKTPVSAPAELKNESFGYAHFGPAGQVASRHHVKDLDVTLVTFKNGVRLNLKHTNFDQNSILLGARLGTGKLQMPKDKPGIDFVADAIFTQGGLGKHSVDDLQRILAGKTVGVNFKVGDDAFQFSGATSPKDLKLELELLTAYLTDPGFRPEALRQARKSLTDTYQRLEHLPRGIMAMKVPRILADGDYRFGLPPLKDVLQRTTDDVRTWLQPALQHGSLEVSLVGDFNVDQAIKLASETLGTLPDRRTRPALTAERQLKFPAPPPSDTFTVDTALQKGIVYISWPTADFTDIHRVRRLNTLAAIFSDRMRIKIREELGVSYSPFAFSRPSNTYKDYGLFNAFVEVNPKQAGIVRSAVLNIAQGLVKSGITDDELVRAVKPEMTQIENAVQTNSYWLNSVLIEAQEYPARLEWARTMVKDYQSITKQDIDKLARKYLEKKNAATFVIIPKSDQPSASK